MRISGLLSRLDRCDWPSWRSSIVSAHDACPIRALASHCCANCRLVPDVCAPLFLVLLHQDCNCHDLVLCLLLIFSKRAHQELLADKNSLLINYVVELGIFSVKHLLFLVIILLLFVLIINIILSLISIDALRAILVVTILLAIVVAVQLLQDVLNLSSELLVALLHQVLKYFRHSKLFGFLSELLSREDRI